MRTKCFQIRRAFMVCFKSINFSILTALFACFSSNAIAAPGMQAVIDEFKQCKVDGSFHHNTSRRSGGTIHGKSLAGYIAPAVPVSEKSGVSRFRVYDNYMSLHVIWIDIPTYSGRDDNQVWRIFFFEDYQTVRDVLASELGMNFPSVPTSTTGYIRGEYPALFVDGNGVVYLICRKTEMGK